MKFLDILPTLAKAMRSRGTDKRRNAYILLHLSGLLSATLAILIIMRLAKGSVDSLPSLGAILALALASFTLARSGRKTASTHVLLWALLSFIIAQMLGNQGIRDTALLALPGVLVIAGMMLKSAPFIAFSASSIVAVAAIGILEASGLLRTRYSDWTDFLDMADMAVILVLTTICVRFMADGLRRGLSRAEASEARYRSLVETSPDAIIILDLRGTVIYASQKAFDIVGASREGDFVGRSFMERLPPEWRERAGERIRVLLAREDSSRPSEYEALRMDGSRFWVEISAAVHEDETGEARELLLVCRDVGDRKAREEARQRDLASQELISAISSRFLRTRRSEIDEEIGRGLRELCELRGIEHAAVLRVTENRDSLFLTDEFHAEGIPELRPTFNQMKPESIAWTMSRVLKGDPFMVDSTAAMPPEAAPERELRLRVGISSRLIVPFHDQTGAVSGCLSFSRFSSNRGWEEEDIRFLITVGGVFANAIQRVRAEEITEASLREKELLLKEIHHRVKNNLQVISSLFSLAAEGAESARGREIFAESMDRVFAMSLVHEQLYASGSLARIDFKDYLEAITANLARSAHRAGIDCEVRAERIELEIGTAMPCGLVVNELVSNALKHAFAGRERGLVRVELRRSGPAEITLSVEDDGSGLPEGEDVLERRSMGMILVTSLALQLRGAVTASGREGGAGARFALSFPTETG